MTYKAPYGQTRVCICMYVCMLYNTKWPLRSSDQGLLQQSYFKTRGDHSFEVGVPKLWRSLSHPVRATESVVCFKALLKTLFYRSAFSESFSYYFWP